MVVVGLTGGIASGKSFVIKYLKTLNILTHESDKEVFKLYETRNKYFVNFLLKNGFKDCFLEKKINKALVRKKIFNNKEKKILLEKYIHREVRKKRNIFLIKNKKKDIIFLDIPLLFENKLEAVCDVICSTIAPLNIRQKRALNRKGMTKTIFNLINKNQVSDKERKKKSRYIINTACGKTKTYLQVDNIIYDVLYKTKK